MFANGKVHSFLIHLYSIVKKKILFEHFSKLADSDGYPPYDTNLPLNKHYSVHSGDMLLTSYFLQ